LPYQVNVANSPYNEHVAGVVIGAGIYAAQRAMEARQQQLEHETTLQYARGTDMAHVASDALSVEARKRYIFDSQQRTADESVMQVDNLNSKQSVYNPTYS
jgi:hypothetical protein